MGLPGSFSCAVKKMQDLLTFIYETKQGNIKLFIPFISKTGETMFLKRNQKKAAP